MIMPECVMQFPQYLEAFINHNTPGEGMYSPCRSVQCLRNLRSSSDHDNPALFTTFEGASEDHSPDVSAVYSTVL